MNQLIIFFVRFIIAFFMAVLIGRLFFQNGSMIKVVILALVMLGFAYLFEYTKRRDKGGKNGI